MNEWMVNLIFLCYIFLSFFFFFQGLWTCYGVSALPHLFGCSTDVSTNHNAAHMDHRWLRPVLRVSTVLGVPHFEQLSVQSVQEESGVKTHPATPPTPPTPRIWSLVFSCGNDQPGIRVTQVFSGKILDDCDWSQICSCREFKFIPPLPLVVETGLKGMRPN